MKRSGNPLLVWVALLALVTAMVFVLSKAYPSTEAVRLRNALLILPSAPADFSWVPGAIPSDFRIEKERPSERFRKIAEDVAPASIGSDFDRAKQLARHLQQNLKDRGPIQSDLETTYSRIVSAGYGYCADFTDVFIALSLAADIPARQWGFSFDGFGGHGHAINEIYDRGKKKWVFLDVFNNFYAVDTVTNEPLSALEFRDFVTGARGDTKLVAIGPARPGFKDQSKALDYYRRGAPQWYMWWGNNVYSYDRNPLVRAAGAVSRPLEQFVAVLVGVHPGVKPLVSRENAAAVNRMFALRTQVRVALAAIVVFGILFVWQLGRFWRCRTRSRSGAV
jgi:hypothetical protein